ncbi:MAG: right-handed parallel beta-helix repeat-containing protein [Leptolyngbyaceae cyanobacterium SU_3_3]|nr:right-handed parallel beta-helix repeat-containing protein [Leptolyngbyaceae cyanobacterium SU_3_3]
MRSTAYKSTENAIVANGLVGMPDAIRLEGNIDQTSISGNVICGNDGAGVYLFKPDGAAQIRDNRITYNGRRYRRAAVYLMGDNHQITGNSIAHQAGSGVAVAAYPRSQRNVIENNRFSTLEGLSIDLVTQGNVGVLAYQKGDGINPQRDSSQRRKDTGNGAIDAPALPRENLP